MSCFLSGQDYCARRETVTCSKKQKRKKMELEASVLGVWCIRKKICVLFVWQKSKFKLTCNLKSHRCQMAVVCDILLLNPKGPIDRTDQVLYSGQWHNGMN